MPEIVHYSEGRLITDGGQNVPDSALTQSGTSATALISVDVSADYTANAWEFVNANTTAANRTVTLPTGPRAGTMVVVRNTGTGSATVAAGGADLVQSAASVTIVGLNASQTFVYNGQGRWRTTAGYLPGPYLQKQVDTSSAAAGGTNTNYCLVVANQITTGAASDGPHDLVFVSLHSPAGGGDCDIRFEHGVDSGNTQSGMVFMNMDMKTSRGFTVYDSANNALMTFPQSGAVSAVSMTLQGSQGVNKNLVLRNGGASGVIKFQKSDGTDYLTADETGIFLFKNGAKLEWAVGSGTAIAFIIDGASTNRLSINGGGGGTRWMNNAFSAANMTIADAGDVSIGRTAPATTATGGFPYIPVMAGTPSGTPSGVTGFVPLVADSTGSKLWAYLGGAWKSVALA